MSNSHPALYYLEVVKTNEKPKFPEDEGKLLIGHQDLENGLTQYWAYKEGSDNSPEDLPKAEVTAKDYPAPRPVLLIDQYEDDLLELIIASDSHALAHTWSNPVNLEEDINSIIEEAEDKFKLHIEHFLTTERVTEVVDNKLDAIAQTENITEEEIEPKPIKPISHTHDPFSHIPTPIKSELTRETSSQVPANSKLPFFIIIVVLLLILAGIAVIFIRPSLKDKISAKLGNLSPLAVTPTQTPIPTQTPTPTKAPIDKSSYKIRVLNGTKTTGAAKTLAAILKEAGWVILSTGNAKNQATDQTQVKTKNLDSAVLEALTADLGNNYQASASGTLLPSDKADIEVTIGKK